MRNNGVAVPKYALKEQARLEGELQVLDTRDEGINRVVKVGRLEDHSYGYKRVEMLYDPHLVWLNEGRFTFAGFERVLVEGKVVEYAQSWLCLQELEEAKNDRG